MNNKPLIEVFNKGFETITEKVKAHSVAVVAGNVVLQNATRQEAHEALDHMLQSVMESVAVMAASDEAGENSKQKVSEHVHAVLTTPDGKKSIGA